MENDMDIRIGERAQRPNGTFFYVKAVDDSDQTVMDEFGTWYAWDDCFFNHGVESDEQEG